MAPIVRAAVARAANRHAAKTKLTRANSGLNADELRAWPPALVPPSQGPRWIPSQGRS